jgi:hypothetical protein
MPAPAAYPIDESEKSRMKHMIYVGSSDGNLYALM